VWDVMHDVSGFVFGLPGKGRPGICGQGGDNRRGDPAYEHAGGSAMPKSRRTSAGSSPPLSMRSTDLAVSAREVRPPVGIRLEL